MPAFECGLYASAARASLTERLRGWQEFLQRRILGLQVFSDAKTEFHSEARMGDFGALSITRYALSPQTMARTSRLIGDGDHGYCITLMESGTMVARKNASSVRINPGQAVVISAACASALQIVEPSVLWGVKLADPERLPSTLLDRCTRDLRVFGGMDIEILMSYCQLIDELPLGSRSAAMAETITEHLCGFVSSSLDRSTG